MNSINFFNEKKKFPVSTQVLDFLQNIIKQAHLLALIGGDEKYILTGCAETAANTWSEGYVVVSGEILPFSGGNGTAESKVRIKETKVDKVAGYDTYTDALTLRKVEFGSNVGGADTFIWSEFKRIKTNLELAATYATKTELDALSNLMMPKGGIIMWSGLIAAIPTGYVLCNGADIEGYGKVPDLSGRFIVGYDSTSSNTPDNVVDHREYNGSIKQNYGAIGNRGGKFEVQLTVEEMPSHDHEIYTEGGDDSDDYKGELGGEQTGSRTGKTGGGKSHENRPPYYVLAFIIKVV